VVRLDFDFSFFVQILWPPWSSPFLPAAILVIILTVVSQTAGILLGFPLALGRISRNRLARIPAGAYLWVFRGTPLLLQILFVYDATAELTNNSPLLFPITRNAVIAGAVTLALNEAAYMTEIIRAGLQAIDAGQPDAAKALGMRRGLVMRRIIVPQALRIIVPPTFNEYINMSKNTSLLALIAVPELITTAQNYYSVNFRYFEALSAAAIWYLLITSILTVVQSRIEARFGERREGTVGPFIPFWERAFVFSGGRHR
jgi:polar amino acid transport system permease protein